MRLWVDDVRPAPEDYIWVKSTNQFLRLFNSAVANSADPLNIEEISLDHDAGNFADDGKDYINILDQLEKFYHTTSFDRNRALIDNINFHIHSQNVVGVENMRRIIRRNGWREV